jgi:hypothetical protein
VNRALSAANACLYGLCHAAIVSGGYSTALGFIHTGKQMSFVYDVADLYKAQFVIPAAFREAAQGPHDLESRVRRSCRDAFRTARLAERILPDIGVALDVGCADEGNVDGSDECLADESRPAEWWKPAGLPVDVPIDGSSIRRYRDLGLTHQTLRAALANDRPSCLEGSHIAARPTVPMDDPVETRCIRRHRLATRTRGTLEPNLWSLEGRVGPDPRASLK